jgi:hypothetical protein
MKKLLTSLLLLLPVFIFGATSTKAQCTISKSDPLVIACATAFGKPGDPATIGTCAILMCVINDKSSSNMGPWYNQTPTQFAQKVFSGSPDEIFGERYTYAQINWIINSLFTLLNPVAGLDGNGLVDLIQKLMDAAKGTPKNPFNIVSTGGGGVYGFVFQTIGGLYSNPPASGVDEVKNIAARFDLAQPVSAQGYGYNGLLRSGGVLAFWKATRNMSYFLIIVLLIVSGFLIMFRVKINPQTVISVQTMIPKLIITMLLVTFSFAIAGFVIDMIYVIIGLFVGLLSANGMFDINMTPTEISKAIGWLSDRTFMSYVWLKMGGILLSGFLGLLIFFSFGLLGAGFAAPTVGLSILGGGIVGAIAGIGFFIWANVVLFKIFLMLMKAYVMIILQIVIAPLQIMLDLLPGQQGFGSWIRNLIANASVFVVVPVMLVLQTILSWDAFASFNLHLKDFRGMGGSDFGLPYAEIVGNALAGGNFVTYWIIGFMIFSITPKVADMIRDVLKIPAFKYGTAFTEAFAPYREVLNQGLQAAVDLKTRKERAEAETIAVQNEALIKHRLQTPLNKGDDEMKAIRKMAEDAVEARQKAQRMQIKVPKI